MTAMFGAIAVEIAAVEGENLPYLVNLGRGNKACVGKVHGIVRVFFHQFAHAAVPFCGNIVNMHTTGQDEIPQLALPDIPAFKKIKCLSHGRPCSDKR